MRGRAKRNWSLWLAQSKLVRPYSKTKQNPDMVVHVCNPSICEAEAEGLWVWPAWSMWWDPISTNKLKTKGLKYSLNSGKSPLLPHPLFSPRLFCMGADIFWRINSVKFQVKGYVQLKMSLSGVSSWVFQWLELLSVSSCKYGNTKCQRTFCQTKLVDEN
jgi:hypothetical protein